MRIKKTTVIMMRILMTIKLRWVMRIVMRMRMIDLLANMCDTGLYLRDCLHQSLVLAPATRKMLSCRNIDVFPC